MNPRHGKIHIDTTEALSSTWGMTAKEVGRAWLDYLAGDPSLFEMFSTHKELRPRKRPHWKQWREIRQRIFERDGRRCTYCGATDVKLECDHVIPVALGGSHNDDNLTTACRPCNNRKGARTAEEFAGFAA